MVNARANPRSLNSPLLIRALTMLRNRICSAAKVMRLFPPIDFILK